MADIKAPVWAEPTLKIMEEKGVKKSHLLPVLNVTTRGAIGHYFRGRVDLSATQLKNLSEFLEVPVSALFGEQTTTRTVSSDAIALTKSLRLLAAIRPIDDKDLDYFFKIYNALGPEEIVAIQHSLSTADGLGELSEKVLNLINQIKEKSV
ncbi:hypothetical protein [Algicola sagamiensis]|uniref:hypothetical protein n=1 Tax=Algicola sagamiensis TaxID=163869 RepID=UPI0003718743|nr:hypothetical protein [Algicola sagamiensis]